VPSRIPRLCGDAAACRGKAGLSCYGNERRAAPALEAPAPAGHSAVESEPVKTQEATMDEDNFNMSIRKFLKTVGVTAQREIEKAVRQALAQGKLKGTEKFPAQATVTLSGIGFAHEIKGEIELK